MPVFCEDSNIEEGDESHSVSCRTNFPTVRSLNAVLSEGLFLNGGFKLSVTLPFMIADEA